MDRYDVCIIGGGASGLAAAAALDGDLRVCIVEKNGSCGRKLAATGGGRCNITNAGAPGADETIAFFRELGLEVYRDSEGRYYPYSNRAEDVTEILLASVSKKNTVIHTGFSAGSVSYDASECGKFSVSDGKKTVTADRLIVAAGGKSYPQLGTTGDGFAIAKSLGHTVERVYPVLAPVECRDMPDLAGVRARGRAVLYRDGREADRSEGEIQFTRDGLSGICIFDLTLSIRAEVGEDPRKAVRRFEIGLDLAPDFTREQLAERTTSFGIVTGRLAELIPPAGLKDFRLRVSGVKGWKSAQCTAGGVRLEEIDMDTMESRLIPGLYFTGEVLDIQYRCGGFNLQNAWSTGIKAARHISGAAGKTR